MTGASDRFAGGDAFSVVKPSSGGEKCSLWASSSAGSAPPCSPARAYCIVEPPPVLYRGGGEKRLQLQVSPRRDRGAGRGVTFRLECEGARVGVGSSPIPCALLLSEGKMKYSVCYPDSLLRGGDCTLCCCSAAVAAARGDDDDGWGACSADLLLLLLLPACCPACLLACVSDGGGLCAALVCVRAACCVPGTQQQPASDQRVVWWRCLPAARPPGAVTLTEVETWVVVEPRGG